MVDMIIDRWIVIQNDGNEYNSSIWIESISGNSTNPDQIA